MSIVLEGEVVGADVEVLPPDVDTKVVEIRQLDSPEMQVRAITVMLSNARTGLLAAIAAQDLPEIVKFKQKATAIHDIAKQVRLGKDIQLDAAEFMRRAERGLGVAIREGQANGTVETLSEARSRGARERDIKLGRRSQSSEDFDRLRPSDFATSTELSGQHKPENKGGRDGGIYGMTDGVSDEQFEEAIAEAKSEGNLSRANVARKAKAKAQAKEPINADDPLIDADVDPVPQSPPKKRLTKHDSVEMVANINGMLNGIVETLPFINPTEVDFTNKANRRVVENIRESLARIRKLLKEIENG